jgi:hypothetical protein
VAESVAAGLVEFFGGDGEEVVSAQKVAADVPAKPAKKASKKKASKKKLLATPG